MDIAAELERVRAEFSRLRRDYQALVDNAPDVLARFDRQGRFLYINNTAERNTGIPASAFLGKTFRELGGLPEPNIVQWEQALAVAFATGRQGRIEYHFPVPERGIGFFECILTPDVGSSGEVESVVTVTRDLTERKQVEDRLRVSEERLRLAVDGADIGTWHWDIPADEQVWSERCKAMFGLPAGVPVSYEAYQARLHPDDRETARLRVARAIEERTPVESEYRVVWPDGTVHWVYAKGQPYYDAQGRPLRFEGIVQSIDARKQSEQAIREAAERQRQFLRDVLLSVTDGKLHLCHTTSDLPPPLAPCGETITLSLSGGIRELRGQAQEAARERGFADTRGHDLVIAVSETAMNAVVHAGGGRGRVCSRAETVQVWVEDEGEGIDVAHLPRAALEKGYTTAGTLGHGMKMVLHTADRVWLLTTPSGTTVVIEQDRIAPGPEWLLGDAA